nr:hypothetical protein [Fimbriimonas ginsengisoli]
MNTILDQIFTEVDQESESVSTQAKVGKNLFIVNGCQILDGLDFYYDAVLHDQIGAKSGLELVASVDDWKRSCLTKDKPGWASSQQRISS